MRAWLAVSDKGEVRFGSLSLMQAPYGVLPAHQFTPTKFFHISMVHETNKYLVAEGSPAHLIFIDSTGLLKVMKLEIPSQGI